MAPEIIVAIVGIAGIVVTASMDMVKSWYSNWLESRKAKHTIGEYVNIDYKVHKELEEILDKYAATRVIIGRLHNGGQFSGGIPMEKFTVSHEVLDEFQVGDLLQQSFQNILLSSFTVTFMKLFHLSYYSIVDVTELQDVNFKKTMQKHDVVSIFMYLIVDIDNKPIAFLAMLYKEKTNLDEIFGNLEDIKLRRDKLANLLSISYNHNKKK